METGLIDTNGKKISIPYYEIGSVAKKIVSDYISVSKKNREYFQEFSKNYTHYEPYLDFLILKLGYGIINPFVLEKGVLFENDLKFAYLKNTDIIDKKIPYKQYPSASDEKLHIKTFSIDDIEDSIISSDGTYFKIDRINGMAHEDYFKIILMELAVNNKMLYEDFLNCNSDVDIYFVNRLGYLHVIVYEEEGNIIYNKNLVNNCIDNLLKDIEDKYIYVELNDDSPYNYFDVDESKKIKKEMSGLNGREK